MNFTNRQFACSLYVSVAFLPSSIAAHLLHAGCTPTEVVVLRHVLEGRSFTLRELAAKTGRSTGVLDQATKKLLGKHILRRECVNGTPKYVLASAEAILCWLREHTAETLGVLRRREEDVHQFLSAVEQERRCPSMEYFEGVDGMERAFRQLFEAADGEILVFRPIEEREEQDPLRDLRAGLNRQRRHCGVFCRTITHNTSLGRRFQARDPFEHRKTVLVPKDQYPCPFEQVIAGECFACFRYEEGKACILRFPHFAQSQRGFFDALWQRFGTGGSGWSDGALSVDCIALSELEGYSSGAAVPAPKMGCNKARNLI